MGGKEPEYQDFNPRTPCGVRQDEMERDAMDGNFNPRTPCGVRRIQLALTRSGVYFNPRTPCGVRHPKFFNITTEGFVFQSTHPLRGATLRLPALLQSLAISIHAPLAGCDAGYEGMYQVSDISIHAPLAGCDCTARSFTTANTHFNPRTPCGVRHGTRDIIDAINCDFNPRTPCGVRPKPTA